jgi:hypothetical protein
MRLYLQRLEHRRTKPVAAGDEEDCYTPHGRRRGVFLSEEPLSPREAEPCDVDGDLLAEYEITADGDQYRTFVVPSSVAIDVKSS